MKRSSLTATVVPLAVGAVVGLWLSCAPAMAGEVDAFEPAVLPTHLSARPEHVPTPFPDDDVNLRGDGPNGWAVGGGVLAGAAVIAGVVAAASHARSKGAETNTQRESAIKLRNASAYTAIGLAGGSGLCFVFASVL